jgi:hypothetical protein
MEAYVGDDLVPDDEDLARGEDDHDLLTFAEGGIRLREEIALAEAALRQAATAGERDALRARLGTLNEALTRNTRQAQASPGETGFLGYRPPPPGGQADADRGGRS